MQLDRVTITGADDSIEPDDLIELSHEFPFVEWGILASQSQIGNARFPSFRWISRLQRLAEVHPFQLSLHLCGAMVRALLVGNMIIPLELLYRFQRVQLNFHADRTECKPKQFVDALREIKKREFIFQLDGVKGNKHLEAAHEYEAPRCYALFDASGGAGTLPREWPKPIYIDVEPGEHGCGEQFPAYHGYAGGLGPQNLATEIPRIAEAAGDAPIWIDMETHVRTPDDTVFSLSRVRKALEICKPFISAKG